MVKKILIAVSSLFIAVCVFAADELPPIGETHNPGFVGEAFHYGQWTMDIDAATNTVAGEVDEAFTLVFFSGVLWCPWCLGLEKDVLDNAAFLEYARTNKIALVLIDNPRRDDTPPTLLREDAYRGAANDTRNGNSGALYLAEHGISPSDAKAVEARNAALQAAWAIPGAVRIGYPTMLLLRKDGSIAGRFSGAYQTTDASSVPPRHSYDLDVNMLRFSEFLAMAKDAKEAGEELNNYVASTMDTLGAVDTNSATLRAMDTVDVYRLTTEPYTRPSIFVQGGEDANIRLELLNAAGQTVKTKSGSLLEGVTLDVDNAVTGTLSYVSVTASGAALAALSTSSTVRAYTITTSRSIVPGMIGFDRDAVNVPHDATNVTVTLRRTGGLWGEQSARIKINDAGTSAMADADFIDVFDSAGVEVAWAHGEGGNKTINIPLIPSAVDSVDKTLMLEMFDWVGSGAGPAPDQCVLTLSGSAYPFFGQVAATFTARTRTALDVAIDVLNTTGGKVTVTKKSGSLPNGVKAAYDARGLHLTGVPKKAGEYTASFQVSEKRGSKKVPGGLVTVTLQVGELIEINSFAAQAITAAEGSVLDIDTKRVVGVIRLSVSATGRITAKYRGIGGTDNLSANAWTRILDDGRSVEAVVASRKRVLTVVLDAAGAFTGRLQTLPVNGVGAQFYDVPLAIVPWTKNAPAEAYQGYYTASLSPAAQDGTWAPEGYSALTLSLPASAVRTGTAKFAGTLANGTKYSGSALLAPYVGESGDQAHLVVYAKAGKGVIGAHLTVDAYAAETYQEWPSAISVCDDTVPYWTVDSGVPETSFTVTLDICGGYYNATDSLVEYWEQYEDLYGPFQLRADGALPVGMYGVATDMPLVDLAVTEKTLKIPYKGINPTKATLTLNKRTGVIRGAFKIPFMDAVTGKIKVVTASYSGVLLPGWTGDCGCSDDGAELPAKPFAMGSFQFSDKINALVNGKNKTVTFKQGHPIIIRKGDDPAGP